MATYWSTILPNGTLYGECPNQGVVMTQSGDTATFRAAGAGKFTNAAGAASFRGAMYYTSQSSALASLNGVAVVYVGCRRKWQSDLHGLGVEVEPIFSAGSATPGMPRST